MIRIAVCDDNEFQLELTTDVLGEHLAVTDAEASVTTFPSGKELLTAVKGGASFDIYILDLIMPDINGMEVASMLRHMKDEGIIIFLTATLEYAVQSYDVGAFYYLVKPLDGDRFCRVIDNAILAVREKTEQTGFDVKTKNGIVNVDFSNVTYANLVERVVQYHLTDGRIVESVFLRGKFREAVEPLTSRKNFKLCGVGLVVNMRYIDALDSESVLLRDGTVLYPSHSACVELREAWLNSRR